MAEPRRLFRSIGSPAVQTASARWYVGDHGRQLPDDVLPAAHFERVFLRERKVYLCEEDAQRALEDCPRDEPQWDGLLHVEAIELDERHVSLN
jgi:hypothetical protein